MTVPKYIIDLMSRAKFNLSNKDGIIPGYTIDIAKRTNYAYVSTLNEEVLRLINWVDRQYKIMSGTDEKICYINSVPKETHFKYMQYATVTIYDPIMRYIEQYINQ